MARNILIENGSHAMHNQGDVAMLQVAVQRLRTHYPEARLAVITAAPARLRECCPGTVAVPADDRAAWYRYQVVSRWLRGRAPSLDDEVRTRFPAAYAWACRAKAKQRGERAPYECFERVLERTDLLVVSGGGFINDHFEPFARPLLEVMRAAKKKGRPVALFGQGIGPLGHGSLREEARRVLPLVDLIALREARASKPLLLELGVPARRLAVTGDDAVECAYGASGCEERDAIGVNVRMAWYAETEDGVLEPLRRALRRAAQALGASLVPVPIFLCQGHDAKSDLHVARRLIESDFAADNAPEGASHRDAPPPLDRPAGVVAQVERCRVVVTGSYHAAVFALAQGTPAVCLARSRYYWEKFLGLADQFGDGCVVLDLDAADLEVNVFEAACRMWHRAEGVRPSLQAAAGRQVAASQAAYRRLNTLTSTRDHLAALPA